jgi:hypothetical protein
MLAAAEARMKREEFGMEKEKWGLEKERLGLETEKFRLGLEEERRKMSVLESTEKDWASVPTTKDIMVETVTPSSMVPSTKDAQGVPTYTVTPEVRTTEKRTVPTTLAERLDWFSTRVVPKLMSVGAVHEGLSLVEMAGKSKLLELQMQNEQLRAGTDAYDMLQKAYEAGGQTEVDRAFAVAKAMGHPFFQDKTRVEIDPMRNIRVGTVGGIPFLLGPKGDITVIKSDEPAAVKEEKAFMEHPELWKSKLNRIGAEEDVKESVKAKHKTAAEKMTPTDQMRKAMLLNERSIYKRRIAAMETGGISTKEGVVHARTPRRYIPGTRYEWGGEETPEYQEAKQELDRIDQELAEIEAKYTGRKAVSPAPSGGYVYKGGKLMKR